MVERLAELERLAARAEKGIDKKLYGYYKTALRDLKKLAKTYIEETELLTFSEQRARYRSLDTSRRIDSIIKGVSRVSQVDIGTYIKDRSVNAYLGVFYGLEGQLRMAIDFNMINEKLIGTLVNKRIAGSTFSQRLHKDTTKLAKVVKQELLQGALDGKGYQPVAKAIAEQTESSYKHSLRIARTEGHRAQTEATQYGYEEAERIGIDLQKRWIASLDDTTRDEHQDLDGQTVGIDEDFTIDGYSAAGPGLFGEPSMDINCRCSTITVVNGISPQLRRDNISKDVVEYKSYNEWKRART